MNRQALAVSLAAVTVLCACRSGAPAGGAAGEIGSIRITRAVAWGDSGLRVATIGFRAANLGSASDTLLGVTSPLATVGIHRMVAAGAGRRMVPVRALVIPGGTSVRLGRGEEHLMLTAVGASVWQTQSIPLALHFARNGTLTLQVPMLQFTRALEVLGE
jgi:copper(I)-binding protein